jgi:hypothetical protein
MSGIVPCMRGMRRGYPFSPGDCIATLLYKASTPLCQISLCHNTEPSTIPVTTFLPRAGDSVRRQPSLSTTQEKCLTGIFHDPSMQFKSDSALTSQFLRQYPRCSLFSFCLRVWSHDPLTITDRCLRRMEDVELHKYRRFAVSATSWQILVFAFASTRATGIPRACALYLPSFILHGDR